MNQRLQIAREKGPPRGDYYVASAEQKVDGPWRYLIGAARVETSDYLIEADEIDWNEDTGDMIARGHVHFEHYERGEKIDAAEAEYNDLDEEGTFYDVSGTAQSTIAARPGLLTTQNPFYFKAKWAERVNSRYILHDGFVTDCLVPNPWWVLKGPEFVLIPGDHAIARRSWFYLKKLPLFYTPWFYKSLKKNPRHSGFLLPMIGYSSLHGDMFGFGYYWAIGRSYDMTYSGIYYTGAGLASHLDFRGRINQTTDFNIMLFNVQSTVSSPFVSSGDRITGNFKSQLGDGWEARGSLDYLSNFAFLQDFTQSINEAVSSETHSVGYVTKHWGDFGVDFVAERDVNFQNTTPGNTVDIRKLPSAELTEREHEIEVDKFPFWVSFNASAGLLDRSQPQFQTALFVDRVDFAPQISTAFHFGDFNLVPTFGIDETQYSESFQNGDVVGQDLIRSSRTVALDLYLPSLERVFNHVPSWMGDKVKHVIEPKIEYKDVSGINNFNDVLRFDELDLLSNTNQLTFSLTNRLLAKHKDGQVTDLFTWQLLYARYFDPTFGGAAIYGNRDIIESEMDLTGIAFLDGPRSYSPISSVMRVQSAVNFEWRTDYDPLRHDFADMEVSLDGRLKSKYFWGLGDTDIHTDPILLPRANQLNARIGYGNPNSRGWNAGFQIWYNVLQATVQFWDFQVTRNTDCCGFSMQYRRFNIGNRDDQQFEFAFAISNIGTFGSLKRQDRMF